jgi:3-oxoacyl-[acyl-carrier protein] reductase
MDKVLVITGGSRGIGLAAVELFSSAGYRIINLSRSNTNLELAEQICVDFTNSNWLESSLNSITKLVGKPDQLVLIHNAAVLLKDDVRNAKNLAAVLQLNLVAPQQLNELIIPLMPSGSSILYIGSTLSHKAVARTLTYSTSKHGVLGLMRASCQDLAGSGIHTACICPGFTDTQMLREHIGQDPEILKVLGKSNAFARLVQPDEIAACLKFCAENPAINGASIDVNLGQIEH